MKEKKENMFETYFEWWLTALQHVGLVSHWKKEPETLVMIDPVTVYSEVHMKRIENTMASHTLMQMATYTRDYDAWFHKSLLDVLFGVLVKSDDAYFLKEFKFRDKGDAWFDFSYYYLFNETEAENEYFKISFDVKPPAKALQRSGKLGSSREFPYNQKLILEKHNIFVNKVIPVGAKDCLFNKTFIPQRYYLADAGYKTRKLNEIDRNINQWMAANNLKKISIPNGLQG